MFFSPRRFQLRAAVPNQAQGSALLEFAISLPILVLFVVGIYDFSEALNLKQKIQQAVQEGAIVAGAQPTSDLQSASGSNPTSTQAVAAAILNSLTGSGGSTISPRAPASRRKRPSCTNAVTTSVTCRCEVMPVWLSSSRRVGGLP